MLICEFSYISNLQFLRVKALSVKTCNSDIVDYRSCCKERMSMPSCECTNIPRSHFLKTVTMGQLTHTLYTHKTSQLAL